jgi:hypothetical protein
LFVFLLSSLGAALASVGSQNLVIAMMDDDANSAQQSYFPEQFVPVMVRRFSSFSFSFCLLCFILLCLAQKFFPKGNKMDDRFTGEHTAPEIAKWLAQKCNNCFDLQQVLSQIQSYSL